MSNLSRPFRFSAFTLVELMTVIGVISILTALLLPALSTARAKVRSSRCVANLKQLQLGYLSYVHDHDDKFMPNRSRGLQLIQQGAAPSWVLGNPKWDMTTSNIVAGLLFPYIKLASPYTCPSDLSRTVKRASTLPRTRSYSLNGYFSPDIIGKGLNVGQTYIPKFKQKLSELHIPGPDKVFGFLDENEQSIDDGLFATHDPQHWFEADATPDLNSWMEMPADRHSRGCTLSFLDSHVESWRWKAPKPFRDYEQPPADEKDREDLMRLQAALPNL